MVSHFIHFSNSLFSFVTLFLNFVSNFFKFICCINILLITRNAFLASNSKRQNNNTFFFWGINSCTQLYRWYTKLTLGKGSYTSYWSHIQTPKSKEAKTKLSSTKKTAVAAKEQRFIEAALTRFCQLNGPKHWTQQIIYGHRRSFGLSVGFRWFADCSFFLDDTAFLWQHIWS